MQFKKLDDLTYAVTNEEGYWVRYNRHKKMWSCECMGFQIYGKDPDFACKHVKFIKKIMEDKNGND